jgi:prepilin-type N-terminal cleavage/methylation domain-containing protein
MKRLRLNHTDNNQHGFTIIELLIATAVFAVILLVVTAGVMTFTRDYYKGIIQSNTETVARTIENTLGQAIQFSPVADTSGPWPAIVSSGNIHGYCINGTSYGYVLGEQLNPGGSGNVTNQVLLANPGVICNDTLQATMVSTSPELMGENMRLAVLTIAPLTGTIGAYTINVRVVFGNDDLLCSPNEIAGSCNTPAAMSSIADYQTPDLQCKGNTGSQFCSVSQLSTVVKKRL